MLDQPTINWRYYLTFCIPSHGRSHYNRTHSADKDEIRPKAPEQLSSLEVRFWYKLNNFLLYFF